MLVVSRKPNTGMPVRSSGGGERYPADARSPPGYGAQSIVDKMNRGPAACHRRNTGKPVSNADREDGYSTDDAIHPPGYIAIPTFFTIHREDGAPPPTYDTYSAAGTVPREYENHPPPEDAYSTADAIGNRDTTHSPHRDKTAACGRIATRSAMRGEEPNSPTSGEVPPVSPRHPTVSMARSI